MSCGMDYKFLEIPEFKEQGYPLLFYDVWVARDMMGLYVVHSAIRRFKHSTDLQRDTDHSTRSMRNQESGNYLPHRSPNPSRVRNSKIFNRFKSTPAGMASPFYPPAYSLLPIPYDSPTTRIPTKNQNVSSFVDRYGTLSRGGGGLLGMFWSMGRTRERKS